MANHLFVIASDISSLILHAQTYNVFVWLQITWKFSYQKLFDFRNIKCWPVIIWFNSKQIPKTCTLKTNRITKSILTKLVRMHSKFSISTLPYLNCFSALFLRTDYISIASISRDPNKKQNPIPVYFTFGYYED